MNSANVALALTLLIELTEQIQKVGAMIAKAQAEGRDISPAEFQALKDSDDAARKRLEDAIAAQETLG